MTATAQINALCTELQIKLSTLTDTQLMCVAYKAGLVQSEYVRPVCSYLDDWILDRAYIGVNKPHGHDFVWLNLQNIKKAVRLAGL